MMTHEGMDTPDDSAFQIPDHALFSISSIPTECPQATCSASIEKTKTDRSIRCAHDHWSLFHTDSVLVMTTVPTTLHCTE